MKSRVTLCCDVLRELRRRALELRIPYVTIECHPQVAELLRTGREQRDAIVEIEKRFGKTVEIKVREDFHFERFDIKGGRRNGTKTA